MTVGLIKVLPFDAKLGFDQRQAVTINGVTYDLFYRYNNYAGFNTLRISRQTDEVMVWSGKLTQHWYGVAVNPATHVQLFAFGVNYLTASDMQIQVFFIAN